MNKPPAFQLYVEEWISSLTIRQMTREEELAYFRLLIHQWDSPFCKLQNDPSKLAYISRMTEEEWRVSGPKIMIKFARSGDKIYNKKLRTQFLELMKRKRDMSSGGRKGMKKRWLEHKFPYNQVNKVDITLDNSPSPSPSPSPKTDKQPRGSPEDLKPKPETATAPENNGFAVFWAAYPPRNGKKSDKGGALREWKKTKSIRPPLDVILKAIERQKATPEWRKENGGYIPDARRWLHGHMWEDEVSSAPATSAPSIQAENQFEFRRLAEEEYAKAKRVDIAGIADKLGEAIPDSIRKILKGEA